MAWCLLGNNTSSHQRPIPAASGEKAQCATEGQEKHPVGHRTPQEQEEAYSQQAQRPNQEQATLKGHGQAVVGRHKDTSREQGWRARARVESRSLTRLPKEDMQPGSTGEARHQEVERHQDHCDRWTKAPICHEEQHDYEHDESGRETDHTADEQAGIQGRGLYRGIDRSQISHETPPGVQG